MIHISTNGNLAAELLYNTKLGKHGKGCVKIKPFLAPASTIIY